MSNLHDNRTAARRGDAPPRTHDDAVTLLEDAFDAVVVAAWNYDERRRAARRPLREEKAKQ